MKSNPNLPEDFQQAFAAELGSDDRKQALTELSDAERQYCEGWALVAEKQFSAYAAGAKKAIHNHLVRLAQGCSVQNG